MAKVIHKGIKEDGTIDTEVVRTPILITQLIDKLPNMCKAEIRREREEIRKSAEQDERIRKDYVAILKKQGKEKEEERKMSKESMDNKALNIVKKYIYEHLDKSDDIPQFSVYTVWKCKTLQNWKWLISTTLHDGMYYEVTYNGDKQEFYLDAYKKFENRCIPATEAML